MTPDFVRRFAPQLALAESDAPSAGINDESHPYDATGTPLPYLEQGGVRQYFGTPVGPDGLRGRQLDAGNTSYTPPAPVPAARSAPFAGLTPDAPMARLAPNTGPSAAPPQDMLRGRGTRYQAGTPIPIPGARSSAEDQIIRGVQQGNVPRDRIYSAAQNPEDMTLGDMLSRFNFQLPNIMPRNDGLRGRDGNGANDSRTPLPEVDVRRDYPRPIERQQTGTVQPVSMEALPDFSTPQGLADFNRRMNLSLGSQVRSQAVQDRLRAQGATGAAISWHTSGRAADIHPRDLGGLTGQAAVNEVKRRLTAAGYPNMQVIWESGRGRRQGTGAHVHIEPNGRPF